MEPKNTREKILYTAIDLFCQRGFYGTSIREIARMVGIKESSIYNHYKNKEEILGTTMDYFKTGILSNRPTEGELLGLIEVVAPSEVMKLIFLKYVKNENAIYDKIARIIFIEQYINPRVGEFFQKNMIEEPIRYYKKVFSMMADMNKVKQADYTLMAEELHYGFLGLMMEYAHIKTEGQYDKEMTQKMVRHIDFIFQHL